jgi:hypothetical protein
MGGGEGGMLKKFADLEKMVYRVSQRFGKVDLLS